MIWTSEQSHRAIADYNAHLARELDGAITSGTWNRDSHQVIVDRERVRAILNEMQNWQKEVGFGPIPRAEGNQTPPSDRILVEGWTTMSRRFSVDRDPYFALYSYPGGRIRRAGMRFVERLIADPLRTPSANQWQQHFINNSVIPTVDLSAESDVERNIVVMPYLDLISAYDVFVRPDQIRNWEGFARFKDLSWAEAMKLLETASVALAAKHDFGLVVGESTLQNLAFTKAGLPLWVEAEMGYVKGMAPNRKFSSDIRTLLVSSWNVLARKYGEKFDSEDLAQAILPVHPSPVLQDLVKASAVPMPLLQHWSFDQFSQYRMGADRKMYAIVRQRISDLVAGL